MMKYRHYAVLGILTITTSVSMLTGCRKKAEKIDLGSTHTTAAETMAQETTAVPVTMASTDPAIDNAANTAGSKPAAGTGAASGIQSVKTTTAVYTSGQVSIQYPVVENLETQKADAINQLLKTNALSVISGLGIQEATDSLTVTCNVLSADRNRITVTYTGILQAPDAAHPTNVFYSNTVDVAKNTSLGLSHFADPYTMAGYVLSGDVVFPDTDEKLKAALMTEKNQQSLEYYTTLFTDADFPFTGAFPASFSYEYKGDIYFSFPVSHALGDYAVVVYTPDTK